MSVVASTVIVVCWESASPAARSNSRSRACPTLGDWPAIRTRSLRLYRRGLDAIHLGEALVEIGLALRLDLALIRRLAVSAVELRHYVHSLRHFPEGRKALRAEAARIIRQVDEQLRGTG